MTITDKIRDIVRGLRRTDKLQPPLTVPPKATVDGHAPGHRHLGPSPDERAPIEEELEPPHDQPWVRTSHSDSQLRRPRG